MMEDIIFKIALGALSLSLTAVSGYGIEALRKLIAKITSETFAAEFANLLTATVAKTTQTYVDDLKKSGSFDKDAQIHALSLSLATLTDSLSQSAKNYIQKHFGDIETYLTTQIEAEVARQKQAA